MRKLLFICLAVAVIRLDGAEVDPAAALAGAKAHISASRYQEAVTLLGPAIASARNITDPAQQKQAETALHFYMALAYSGLRRDDEALEHLEEAFRLSPNIRAVDRTKFDAHFVALFDKVRPETAGAERFEELYPGFSGVQTADDESGSTDGVALEILGSKREKREWHAIASEADRTRFLTGFWGRRDRTPGTSENEFRDTFGRRVAFANAVFGSPGQPGALTDRGRVFTVLGEPAQVRRRALNDRDAIQSMNIGSVGIAVGTIEYWFYSREQLHVRHAKPTITFRFVTHQGIGNHVLQKDGIAMNALAVATAVREKR